MGGLRLLQRTTGPTESNLSSDLTKPEEAGLVKIAERFIRKNQADGCKMTGISIAASSRADSACDVPGQDHP